MQVQTTLDGKPLYSGISDTDYMRLVDQLAATEPEKFARYCEEEGIRYHNRTFAGNLSMTETFLCCNKLQKHFGFFTHSMISALMSYPIED